jgi:polyisoprenoid-binding protein YceI
LRHATKISRGADWFNTTEFPEMTYVGSEFVKKDEALERSPEN